MKFYCFLVIDFVDDNVVVGFNLVYFVDDWLLVIVGVVVGWPKNLIPEQSSGNAYRLHCPFDSHRLQWGPKANA